MTFLFKLLVIYAIALVIPKVARAEFVPLKSDRTEKCELQLTEVAEIPHQCLVIKDNSSPLEVWQNRLDFDFGQLSRSNFKKLQTIYGGWSQEKSQVSYDPQRNYQLLDFLPPLIQALNAHRFIPEFSSLKLSQSQESIDKTESDLDLKPSLYLNCWGLTYEILRAAQELPSKPTLFMAQSSLMLEQIQNNSIKLLNLEKSERSVIPGLITRPGDLVLIWHKSKTGNIYLDHTAIALADGVYFEKAGTGENVPIRLIDQATMLKIWSPAVFNYEIRRPKKTVYFPKPSKVFSLDAPEIKSKFIELNDIISELKQDLSISWDLELNKLELENSTSLQWFHITELEFLTLEKTGRAKLNNRAYQPLLVNE